MHAIRDLQVRRGVRLERFAAGELLRVACREPASGSDTWTTLELRGRDGTLHFLASAEMGTPGEAPRPRRRPPCRAPRRRSCAPRTVPAVLFHGHAFQAIPGARGPRCCGRRGRRGGASPSWAGRAPITHRRGRARRRAPARDRVGPSPLRRALAADADRRLRSARRGTAPRAAPLRADRPRGHPLRTLCDVALVTAAGQVVAELQGVEMKRSRLRRSPRPRSRRSPWPGEARSFTRPRKAAVNDPPPSAQQGPRWLGRRMKTLITGGIEHLRASERQRCTRRKRTRTVHEDGQKGLMNSPGVAIVGQGCVLPGALDPASFWRAIWPARPRTCSPGRPRGDGGIAPRRILSEFLGDGHGRRVVGPWRLRLRLRHGIRSGRFPDPARGRSPASIRSSSGRSTPRARPCATPATGNRTSAPGS